MLRSNVSALDEDRSGVDAESLKRSLIRGLHYSVGKNPAAATARDWFMATASVVRGRLVDDWTAAKARYDEQDVKRVYYLSMEFLTGRLLTDALRNIGLYDACRQALAEFGLDLEAIAAREADPGLGNGGLGRLAACLVDSMATLGLPGYGYGIRYDYGMFTQHIQDGWQVEGPDTWLRYGNPWEFARPELLYPVKFYGRVVEHRDAHGHLRHLWDDTQDVLAMAYDAPVPGYRSGTVNTLRLWSAKATREFDLHQFNAGDYVRAVEAKNQSETLSRVLYPSDATADGRELRFKQEYFFASATIQDILRRFRRRHDSFDQLPDKVAIQINDTHPAVAVAELMRLLVDMHAVPWERAWDITTRTFAYTNHTLMPEALETWPVRFFETILPRHLQIIYEINDRFLRHAAALRPDDAKLLQRLSCIDEGGERSVRMAHLAFVGSHTINGVSAVHTDLMRRTTFGDFARLFPDKIVNVTNGITPRRWLYHANPELAALVSSRIGDGWLTDLELLEELAPLADDAAFRQAFRAIKRRNKQRLAADVDRLSGIEIDPDSLFDVQVKRIHEYKRQLLNVLHVITLYNRMRARPDDQRVPRTVIFAGKAAPSYTMAKLIVKLIHNVAYMVHDDPLIAGRLKVAFVPNYRVTNAELIIPAAELSEQISTAGTEASGTGNMKLALNGAITIGTLDGANIEIREAVGEENFFEFGLTTDEVVQLRVDGYDPRACYEGNAELKQVLDMIASGHFSPDVPHIFRPIVDSLLNGDPYLLLADYASYVACHERAEALYRDRDAWTRRAILNVARVGRFSSDRAVRDYARTIWDVDQAGGT